MLRLLRHLLILLLNAGSCCLAFSRPWSPSEDSLWRGDDGRLWHLKTLAVSQCIRDTKQGGRRFDGGVGSPVRWRSFAQAVRRNLASGKARSWRRLAGFALQHHLCRQQKHSQEECIHNTECCPLGVVAAHIVLLLSAPEAYGMDVRLLGALSPAHRWERLGIGVGYVLWNPVGFRLMDILYSGWPLFALLRELRPRLRRIWTRPQKGVGQVARALAAKLAHASDMWTAAKAGDGSGNRQQDAAAAAAVCAALDESGRWQRLAGGCPAEFAERALQRAEELLRKSPGSLPGTVATDVEEAVNQADAHLKQLLSLVIGSGTADKAPVARVVMAFLITLDSALPQLERIERRVHQATLVSIPPAEMDGRSEAMLCPAADIPEQGALRAEAGFTGDFHSALGAGGFKGAEQTAKREANSSGMEAWVTFLWGGTGARAVRASLVHAEVIRTLAHSVRRAEAPLDRPFVVLTVGRLRPSLEAELAEDGLLVRPLRAGEALPSWHPEWVERPASAGSWFGDRGLERSFPQRAAWALREYSRVVVLDADTLVLGRIDELFDLGRVGFAATLETHSDQEDVTSKRVRSRTYLVNAGVMSLRPNRYVFEKLEEAIQRADIRWVAERNGIWGEANFQSVIDVFLLVWTRRHGMAIWSRSGGLEGCVHRPPSTTVPARPEECGFFPQWRLGILDHCLLPLDYNFYVDFPHIFQLTFSFRLSIIGGKEAPHGAHAWGAWEWDATRGDLFNSTLAWLRRRGLLRGRPKIIHFPGIWRKPWQRWAGLSRSPWDELWWKAHEEMCMASAAPCRLSCGRQM